MPSLKSKEELLDFAKRWLAAWTGNRPDKLIEFYAENAFYSDPAKREGIRGKAQILDYFVRLLDVYHDWTWEPIEVFPTAGGMVVKWQCWIKVGGDTIHEIGLDIVEIAGSKISRNEVYFDRRRLVELVEAEKRRERLIH